MPAPPSTAPASAGRLDRWARSLARRRSLQSLDRYARIGAAVIPRLNRARQLRVMAVTGIEAGVQAWWQRAVRADVEQFRTDIAAGHERWQAQISARDAADLAWLTLQHHRNEEDLHVALALARWAAPRRPHARLVALEAALLLNQPDAARALVDPGAPTDLDRRALIDLAHPALGGDADQWNDAWARWWPDDAGSPRAAGAEVSLASLTTAPLVPADEARTPLVSVVVSSYRPGAELAVAVRSVLASTWTAIEVLVVDDASGEDFADTYAAVAALDERVRVHHMATNGGTYAIRNWALEHARGEYLTFHDSDDWMHPQRLEIQVRHLLRTRTAACTTRSARVSPDVRLVNARSLGLKVCEPSLMIQRERVRNHVGFFDPTRKAADAEYRLRIERSGLGTVAVVGAAAYTLQRIAADSLSDSDIRRYWVHLERRIHRAAYERWHQRAARAHLPLHIGTQASAGARAFYAPPLISGDAPPEVDLVVDLDLLDARIPARRLARALDRLASSGVCVGLRHGDQWQGRHTMVNPATAVIDLLNDAVVTYVPAGHATGAPSVHVTARHRGRWSRALRDVRMAGIT